MNCPSDILGGAGAGSNGIATTGSASKARVAMREEKLLHVITPVSMPSERNRKFLERVLCSSKVKRGGGSGKMQHYRDALPQLANRVLVTDGGLETTLMFL